MTTSENRVDFQISTDEKLYRTITRAHEIADERPLAAAFILRELPRDIIGLSVDYNIDRIPDDCGPGLDERSKKGVFSFRKGQVEDLGLTVVPDTTSHANISGLPRKGKSTLKSEQLAAALAEISHTEWLKPSPTLL